MNRLFVVAVAFSLVLYLGVPALAQHGGRGLAGGSGRAAGGMPHTFSGDERGNAGAGREMASPAREPLTSGLSKGPSRAGGKFTAGELLRQNTKLSSKLQGLLPGGTNMEDAAEGFGHLGQFVAAVHVSHNLGIPFVQLKTEMTHGSSLGQTIHKLKPSVDASQEAIKANQQALDDMEKSMAAK